MISVDETTGLVSDPSGTGGKISRTVTIAPGGQWVHLYCWGYNGGFVSGDVKDGANDWGAPSVAYANPNNSDREAIFTKWFPAAGSVTIDLTPSTVTYHSCYAERVTAKSNCVITASAGAHANSTSPTTPAVSPISISGSSAAFVVLTHNSGNPTISAGTGYTLGQKVEDYGGAVQPGAGCRKVQSGAASMTGAFSLTSSVEWAVSMIVMSEPPDIYQVLGGGGNGYVDNSFTDTITLPFKLLTNQAAIAVVPGFYAYDFSLSFLKASNGQNGSAGGWVQSALETWGNVGAVGSRDASSGQNYLIATSNITTISIDSSAVSTDDPDAGKWYRWAVIVVEQPDLTHGFATATPASNGQANITVVAPGSVTPGTTKTLTVMTFCDRGHATSLEPVTWSSDINDEVYTGTENSAHQSGSFGRKQITATTAQSPTCTLNNSTVGARSTVMSYNLAGGTAGAIYTDTIGLAAASLVAPSAGVVMSGAITLAAAGAVAEAGGNSVSRTIGLSVSSLLSSLPALVINRSVQLPAASALSVQGVSTILGLLSLGGAAQLTPTGSLVLSLAQALTAAGALGINASTGPTGISEAIGLSARAAMTAAVSSILAALTQLAAAAGVDLHDSAALGEVIAAQARADIFAAGQQSMTGLVALGAAASEAEHASLSMQASLALGIAALLAEAASTGAPPSLQALRFASEQLRANLRFTRETLEQD